MLHVHDVLDGYASHPELRLWRLGQKLQELVDVRRVLRVARVLVDKLLVVQVLPLDEVPVVVLPQKLERVELIPAIEEDVEMLLR